MSQVLIRGKPFEKLWGRGAGPKAKKIPASKNQWEKIEQLFVTSKKVDKPQKNSCTNNSQGKKIQVTQESPTPSISFLMGRP